MVNVTSSGASALQLELLKHVDNEPPVSQSAVPPQQGGNPMNRSTMGNRAALQLRRQQFLGDETQKAIQTALSSGNVDAGIAKQLNGIAASFNKGGDVGQALDQAIGAMRLLKQAGADDAAGQLQDAIAKNRARAAPAADQQSAESIAGQAPAIEAQSGKANAIDNALELASLRALEQALDNPFLDTAQAKQILAQVEAFSRNDPAKVVELATETHHLLTQMGMAGGPADDLKSALEKHAPRTENSDGGKPEQPPADKPISMAGLSLAALMAKRLAARKQINETPSTQDTADSSSQQTPPINATNGKSSMGDRIGNSLRAKLQAIKTMTPRTGELKARLQSTMDSAQRMLQKSELSKLFSPKEKSELDALLGSLEKDHGENASSGRLRILQNRTAQLAARVKSAFEQTIAGIKDKAKQEQLRTQLGPDLKQLDGIATQTETPEADTPKPTPQDVLAENRKKLNQQLAAMGKGPVPEPGGGQTPVNSDQQQTPVNSDQRQTPVNSDQRQTPVNSDQQQTPVNGDQQQTPVNGDQQQTPVSSDQQQTPPRPLESSAVPSESGDPKKTQHSSSTDEPDAANQSKKPPDPMEAAEQQAQYMMMVAQAEQMIKQLEMFLRIIKMGQDAAKGLIG